jgi:hypothetical protein
MKCSVCEEEITECNAYDGDFHRGNKILHVEVKEDTTGFLLIPFVALIWSVIANAIILGIVLFILLFFVLFNSPTTAIHHYHNLECVEEQYPNRPEGIVIKKARVIGNWDIQNQKEE